MNQFFDKIEATLRQVLRGTAAADGSATPTVDAQVRAAALTAFVVGQLQRYHALGLPPRAVGTSRSHDRADRLSDSALSAARGNRLLSG
jgi:hypothetical protein